jgi:hypothetical protein
MLPNWPTSCATVLWSDAGTGWRHHCRHSMCHVHCHVVLSQAGLPLMSLACWLWSRSHSYAQQVPIGCACCVALQLALPTCAAARLASVDSTCQSHTSHTLVAFAHPSRVFCACVATNPGHRPVGLGLTVVLRFDCPSVTLRALSPLT